jgi:hypothetical protein
MREPDIHPGTTSTHESPSIAIRLAVANVVSTATEETALANRSCCALNAFDIHY